MTASLAAFILFLLVAPHAVVAAYALAWRLGWLGDSLLVLDYATHGPGLYYGSANRAGARAVWRQRIPLARLHQIKSHMDWRISGGRRCTGTPVPCLPETADERRLIERHWRTMNGTTSYYDAVLSLIAQATQR